MKEIIREFGTTILAIVTGILVISILFGVSLSEKTGILEIAGMGAEKAEIDYTAYQDFNAVKVWHERIKPRVSYIGEYGRFFEEEEMDFLERYYAEDMEGIIYPMDQVILGKLFPNIMFGKVLDIRTSGGISILNEYSKEDGTIRFPRAGIYETYFQIRDRENLTSIYKIPIAVDVGRE